MRAFKFIVVMRTENVGRDNRGEMTAKLLVVGTKMKGKVTHEQIIVIDWMIFPLKMCIANTYWL